MNRVSPIAAVMMLFAGAVSLRADTASSEVAMARPPKDAVVLFDGVDTSAWMQHKSMRIPTEEEMKSQHRIHFS